MTHFKQILATLAAALQMMPLVSLAGPIDSDAALAIARQVVASRQGDSFKAARGELNLYHVEKSSIDDGLVDYYVFNASDGNGFVIVAGDDRSGDPVLAYGDRAIDLGDIPENTRWLLDQYKARAEYLQLHPDEAPARRADATGATVIEPMLSSRWGQYTPYRNQSPTIDGKPCVTGCVATSMAQVMRYWHYPPEAPALEGYRTTTNKIEVPALQLAVLDWNNMLDRYPEGGYSEREAVAVATLMRYCGQAAKTDYGIAGSGAWIVDELNAMKLFGYSSDAECVTRINYSDNDWMAMMDRDLQAGRPVLYTGSGNGQVHSFVIDGTDGSKYHINWGWNGSMDGYFALGSFSVYNDNQQMLVGVHPDDEFVYEFSVDGIYYSKTSDQTVMVTYGTSQYDSYRGVVNIPARVNNLGTFYDVTGIGTMAFTGSTGLQAVTIPESVTSIGARAFDGCAALESVNIPSTVTAIGSQAFNGCTSLTSIEIPDGIKTLGNGFFAGCSSLTTVVLPSGLTTINNNLFAGCSRLASIEIPAGVTTIGNDAFNGCSSLTAMTVPAGVSRIGDAAFKGCSGLAAIMLPAALKSIGVNAFQGCTGMGRVDAADLASWLGLQFGNEYATPLAYGADLYLAGQQLTHLVIPDGVQTVGNYAFSHVKSLARVTVPQSLTAMGSGAFAACDNLGRVDAASIDAWCRIQFADTAANPLSLARHLFVDEREVVDLVVPPGCTTINDYAFYNATGLVSVKFEPTLTAIGKQAFAGTSLVDIVCLAATPPAMPDLSSFTVKEWFDTFVRVPEASLEAYKGDAKWHNFYKTLPVNVDFEQDGALYYRLGADRVQLSYVGLSSLDTMLVIPSEVTHDGVKYTVTAIGNHAFYWRQGITVVDIPPTITAIGEDAFRACNAIREVRIHDLAAWCGIAFASGANPASDHKLSINGEVGRLLMIPEGVTAIGARAFEDVTQFRHVVIPKTVSHIGNRAFYNLSLQNLFCMAVEPPELESADVFTCYGYYTNLRVREGSIEAYKAHAIWKRFGNVSAMNCDFEQDGMLFAHLKDHDVELAAVFSTIPDGKMVIPTTITVDGEQYTVTGIGSQVFMARSNIAEVDIPATITSMGDNAFYQCDGLKRIHIHDLAAWCRIKFHNLYANPLSWGHHLYLDGAEVVDLHVPEQVDSIGSYAFAYCHGLRQVFTGDRVKIIGQGAFQCCDSLSSVTLGHGVEIICQQAFDGCSSLARFLLSDGLLWIEKQAFGNSFYGSGSHIQQVTIPDVNLWFQIHFEDYDANPLQNAALYSDGQLVTHLVIPDTVTVVNPDAFHACASIQTVTVPPTIKKFGYDAFGSGVVTTVNISDLEAWLGIEFEGKNASPLNSTYGWERSRLVLNGEVLTHLAIPASVKHIPDYCFVGCGSLESVSMGSGVESVGMFAFENCSVLETVDCGEHLRSIGMDAFSQCSELKTVVMPNSVAEVDEYAFFYCKKLENLELSTGLTRIKAGTFSNCQNLQEVTIPNRVMFVARDAFASCSRLKRLTIGSRVDTIEAYRSWSYSAAAFSHCDSLETITCLPAVPPVLGYDAFSGMCYGHAVLRVPETSLEAYRDANEWKRFASIEGFEVEEPGGLPGDVNGDEEVNIADINAVIDGILGADKTAVMDVNGDEEINLADVNAIIDMILNKNQPIVE